MFDLNRIYCTFCVAKLCFNCMVKVEHETYAALVDHFKDHAYDLSTDIKQIPFSTRVSFRICKQCEWTKHMIDTKQNSKLFNSNIDPYSV